MSNYPTDIHGPAASAPTVTYKVCHCEVCGVQWQSRGPADEEGCSFCDAPADAITVVSEAPTYAGTVDWWE